MLRFLLAALALIASCPARASEDVFQPTSKWEMRYDASNCRLRRGFGEGKDFIAMELVRTSPTESFQLVLAGKRLSELMGAARLWIRFGDFPEAEPTLIFYGNQTDGPTFLVFRIDAIVPPPDSQRQPTGTADMHVTPEQEAAVHGLTIRRGTARTTLALDNFGRAMAAMRACTTNLVQSWGYDPANPPASPPIPASDQDPWIVPADYPQDLVMRGRRAYLHYRLDVGPDGKVEKCAVIDQIGNEAFERISCEALTKRATFIPARAANGTIMRWYYVGSVRWTVGIRE